MTGTAPDASSPQPRDEATGAGSRAGSSADPGDGTAAHPLVSGLAGPLSDGAEADIGWASVSTLLAGPLVWGGVGWGLDHLLGTSPICLVIGLLMGGCLGFFIVYSRFGRDQS